MLNFLYKDQEQEQPIKEKEEEIIEKNKNDKFEKKDYQNQNPDSNMENNKNKNFNSSNFSFNHLEKNHTQNIKSNTHTNLFNISNNQNMKRDIISELNKTKTLNESILNLSYYNNVQDGIFGFTLLLKEYVKLDSKIEIYKEKIAISEDLELNDIFKFFDVNYKGYFLFDDFKEGINNLEIYADSLTLKSLFKYIDRDNDNSISYNEFCDFICPRNSELSAAFRNKAIDNNKDISENSRTLVVDFFRILIDNEQRLESIKNMFVKKPSYNISELFQILRGKIKCFIVKKDVKTNLIKIFLIFNIFPEKF